MREENGEFLVAVAVGIATEIVFAWLAVSGRQCYITVCGLSVCRQVLLVTTSRSQDLWIVPGGGIEPTEDPRVAALREVQEEAGAKGSLGRCLGVFEVHEPL